MTEQDNEVKVIITADASSLKKELESAKQSLNNFSKQSTKTELNIDSSTIKSSADYIKSVLSGSVSNGVKAGLSNSTKEVKKESSKLGSLFKSILTGATAGAVSISPEIKQHLKDAMKELEISDKEQMSLLPDLEKDKQLLEKALKAMKEKMAELSDQEDLFKNWPTAWDSLIEEEAQVSDAMDTVNSKLAETEERIKDIKDTLAESKSLREQGKAALENADKIEGEGATEAKLSKSLTKVFSGKLASSLGLDGFGRAISSITDSLSAAGIQLGKLAPTIAGILIVVKLIGKAWEQVKKFIKAALEVAKQFAKEVATVITTVLTWETKLIAQAGKLVGQFGLTEIKAIGKAVTSIFNLMISGVKQLYSLFKSVFSLWSISYSEAVGNIYTWAKLNNNELSKSLDLITTDIWAIQNSLASMVIPLIQKIAPLIDAITDKVLVLANAIAKLFAQLSGQSSYVKVTKAARAFTDANNAAAQSLKRVLLNIDELNKLDDTGLGDIASAYKEETTELEKLDFDAFNFGVSFGEKLKDWLDTINWDEIKQKASDIGEKLAQVLNGIFSVKDLGTSFGATLAEVVNTAFSFLESYVTTIDASQIAKQVSDMVKGFFINLDYESIDTTIKGVADNIVKSFNTFVGDEERVEAIAEGLAKLFRSAVAGTTKLLDDLNLEQLVANITKELNALFSDREDIQKLSDSIFNFISKSVNGVLSLITDLKWENVVDSMVKSINKLLNNNERVTLVAEKIHDLFEKACNSVTKTIKNIDWDRLVENITTYIKNAILALDGKDIGDAIITLFNAALNLAIKTPWAELAQFGSDVVWRIISEMPSVFKNVPGSQVASKLSEVLNIIIDDIQPDKIGSTVNAFVKWVGDFWTTVKDTVKWKELVDKVCEAIKQVDWAEALKVVFEVVTDCIKFEYIFTKNVWATLVDDIVDDLTTQFGKKVSEITGLGEGWGKKIANGLVNGIKGVLSLANPFGSIWTSISNITSAISKIKSSFSSSSSSYDYDDDYGKSYYKRYATGGVVTQPTRAIVGEYAGAKTNPEIITPESKMREVFMSGNSELANVYIQVGQQIISAIQNQSLEVSIGDDTIAKSAARGNNSYRMMTGQSLFA